jgi:hypothetical protein
MDISEIYKDVKKLSKEERSKQLDLLDVSVICALLDYMDDTFKRPLTPLQRLVKFQLLIQLDRHEYRNKTLPPSK